GRMVLPVHRGRAEHELGEGQVEQLGDFLARPVGADFGHQIASSPCDRSAMMSSICSMPTDTRTTSGPAPVASSASPSSWLCVVEAGWMISERVSPRLARWLNIFTEETSFTPASYPPLRPKVNTAPPLPPR